MGEKIIQIQQFKKKKYNKEIRLYTEKAKDGKIADSRCL